MVIGVSFPLCYIAFVVDVFGNILTYSLQHEMESLFIVVLELVLEQYSSTNFKYSTLVVLATEVLVLLLLICDAVHNAMTSQQCNTNPYLHLKYLYL